MDMERISDVKFRMGLNREAGMNAAVTVYTTAEMLEKMNRDMTLRQAANAATLPGLAGDVLVMPDGHEGYGFPVGGVAAFDADEGIISPGAIGFDINCLHPDTRLMDVYGALHKISDIENVSALKTLDLYSKKEVCSKPVLFMKKSSSSIFKISTESGRKILASPDHPILTQRGMVEARMLESTDRIITNGFDGVEYERPEHRLILSEGDLLLALEKAGVQKNRNGIRQTFLVLKELGLNEIYSDTEKLPLLIKLMGFIFGGGAITKAKPSSMEKGGYTSFYGKENDLRAIAADIERLGFRCSMYRRRRHHRINTRYGLSEFDYEEFSLSVGSRAFAALLIALGTPFGEKTTAEYRIPAWLMEAKLWQKRLFLSSFFGAELSKPKNKQWL